MPFRRRATPFALGVLIPGDERRNGFGPVSDVGGAIGHDSPPLASNGGKTADQRMLVNGVALSTMIGGGWGGGAIPNMSGQAEIRLRRLRGGCHGFDRGVRINFIPRNGGNRF